MMRRWLPYFTIVWVSSMIVLGLNTVINSGDDKIEEILAQLGQCKRRVAASSFDHLHSRISALEEELEKTKKRLQESADTGKCPPCEAPKCPPRDVENAQQQDAEKVTGDEPWSLTPNIRKREKVRRRVLNTMREMWFYIRRQVGSIRDSASGDTKSRLSDVLEDLIDYYQIAAIDIESLGDVGGMKQWRQSQADKVTAMINERIHNLQEPSDCSGKRLVCDIGKGCGFGCQIHHVFYCMSTAFGTGRTFIMQGNSWSYSRTGWNGVFQPTSAKCEASGGGFSMWRGDDDTTDVVKMPIIDGVSPRPRSLPLAVPSEFIDIIEGFHSYPSVYWFGHIARYVMRYADPIKKSIEERLEQIGFKHPIVGYVFYWHNRIRVSEAKMWVQCAL